MAEFLPWYKPGQPVPANPSYGLTLPENTNGRDFVMGDLHGEMPALWSALAAAGFDKTTDRLFSVGDLIDRGADSMAALRLLREPWFYAVQGNHEQMMVEALIQKKNAREWLENGGNWHLSADRDELLELAALAAALPKILQVGEVFRVVHAEWPHQDAISATAFDQEKQIAMQWSRTLHLQYVHFLKRLANEPEGGFLTIADVEHSANYIPIQHGIPLTFCGHTAVKRPGLWRSHFLLDCGCGWWTEASLTILDARIPTEIYQHFLKVRPGAGDIYE